MQHPVDLPVARPRQPVTDLVACRCALTDSTSVVNTVRPLFQRAPACRYSWSRSALAAARLRNAAARPNASPMGWRASWAWYAWYRARSQARPLGGVAEGNTGATVLPEGVHHGRMDPEPGGIAHCHTFQAQVLQRPHDTTQDHPG